ncbi:MAG TPA: serine/threonine-protein kinase [Gemmatimonadales bacterium]|nr:serine/threonine-protein kinase [Gemmatimonadales bacterium]
MNSERWRAVRAVFDELVELKIEARAGRLAELGSTDPDLRRAVETLLEADPGAEERLTGALFDSDPIGLTGRTVSHFRVLGRLGSGGMGVVYSAEDTRLNRVVALKLPLPEYRLDSSVKARFLREARSAAALDHPNLCSIYEVGESEDGLLFMAMARYRGETLKARLAREGALGVPDALEIARQIAQGLGAAHEAGIVHRDLKPGNLMLLPDGIVKILDFGLARVRDLSLTEPRTLLGTAAYMAPEQIGGDEVDGRADLWALGVVLYEMLTGRQPFRGEHEISIAHAIVHEEPSPPSELRRELPSHVEGVVLGLLRKDPARRYRTAADVAADVAAIQFGHAPSRLGRARRASPALRWSAVVGLAAAVPLVWAALAAHRGDRAASGRLEPNLLAVAPFDVPDSSLQLWSEGLVDILSQDLDGAGPLQTVPQSVVLRGWSGRADGASAAQLGSRTGAGLVVFGHLVRRGNDSVGLRAAVMDRSSGTTMRDLEVAGHEERMGQLADSLGVEILRVLGHGRPIGAVPEVTIGARSLPALKAFLRAEQFYRRGFWDSAAAHYDQAIAQDAEFPLALRRMAQVLGWGPATQERYLPQVEYRRLAVALNRGLRPRDSLMLLADSLRIVGPSATDPDAAVHRVFGAVAVLEEAARRYPGDPEIWYELGEARYHEAAPAGGPPGRTLEAFDRAIALDPGFGPAYEHAVEVALQLRRSDQAIRYARTGAALAPGYEASTLRLAALVLDSGIGAASVARALPAASGNTLLRLADHLRWATDSGEAAVAVLREVHQGSREAEAGGGLLTNPLMRGRHLAWALAYRGHLREAARLVIPPPPGERFARALVVDPFLDLALFGAVPDALARTIFSDALEPDADWGGPASPLSSRYLRGAPWWLARRDTAALHRLVARAAREVRQPGSPVAALRGRYYHAVGTAYLALTRGDSAAAARLLVAIPDTLCLMAPCAHEKILSARLHAARAEYREAAELLDRWSATGGTTPSAVLAALERGRIAERLGDSATARDRYRFVAEAWRNADAELQPYVTEARAAVERLGS